MSRYQKSVEFLRLPYTPDRINAAPDYIMTARQISALSVVLMV